jgi:IS30 family transposase
VQSVWKSLLAKDEILDGIQTPDQFMAYIGQMAIYKVYELNRHFRQTACRDINREVRLEEADGTAREEERGTRAFLPVDVTAHCPDEIAEARERWEDSLADCGERATKIVALKLQRASDEQIGQALGVSPETVRREVRGILERFHA